MFAEAQAAAQRRVNMEHEMQHLKNELRVALAEAQDDQHGIGMHGAAPLLMPWGAPPDARPSARPLPPPSEPPPPLM
jgi:hypothetical protein